MASYNVAPLEKLIEQFERLPGIGHKTAQRLAYFVLNLSKTEAEELGYEGDNIVPVEFTDGAYHNFEKSQKIVDGVYIIEAVGHTTGNSLVIAEDDGLFYMFQGDITYTDEALYENKLSVVFEDLEKARETFDQVREFVKNNPTVYLSTHTPYGPENLENKAVIDLENPPESIYYE